VVVKERNNMDFKELTNKVENFGKSHPVYWSNALAGEVGELGELINILLIHYKMFIKTGNLCNTLKKLERDNILNRLAFKEEMADIFIYLALTADVLNLDLERAILDKLEVIKERREKVT
jgi:NTP pyrophosphatase (non-canonical NTP hydrolase)